MPKKIISFFHTNRTKIIFQSRKWPNFFHTFQDSVGTPKKIHPVFIVPLNRGFSVPLNRGSVEVKRHRDISYLVLLVS